LRSSRLTRRTSSTSLSVPMPPTTFKT
jgi:hypothetical protein